jgi:hypothetical protein
MPSGIRLRRRRPGQGLNVLLAFSSRVSRNLTGLSCVFARDDSWAKGGV